MANRQGDFIWYELMTPDPEGSRRFYSAVVGWTIEDRPSGEMDYRMIAAPDGLAGGMMTLTPAMIEGGARACWMGYVGVDNVDATVASITAAGGSIHMPAWDIPGVGRIAMVADPQGAPFYVMRGASDETSHAFDGDKVGHCSWNELVTSDQDAALTFYAGQFGWTKAGGMDMGPMGEYSFIEQSGTPIGAMMNRTPESPPPVWNYYFRVADIDAAASSIAALRGKILTGPQEVPGDQWVIQGIDPQGAAFGLVGKKL